MQHFSRGWDPFFGGFEEAPPTQEHGTGLTIESSDSPGGELWYFLGPTPISQRRYTYDSAYNYNYTYRFLSRHNEHFSKFYKKVFFKSFIV